MLQVSSKRSDGIAFPTSMTITSLFLAGVLLVALAPGGMALEKSPLLLPPMKAKYDDSLEKKKAEKRASPEKNSSRQPVSRSGSLSPKRRLARQLLNRGQSLFHQGRVEEAEAVFRRAVLADPANPDGFFNLGAVAEGKGDLVASLGHYRAGLILAPGDAELKQAVASVEKMLAESRQLPVVNVAQQVVPQAPVSAPVTASNLAPPYVPSLAMQPQGQQVFNSTVNSSSYKTQSSSNKKEVAKKALKFLIRQAINIGISAAIGGGGGCGSFGF